MAVFYVHHLRFLHLAAFEQDKIDLVEALRTQLNSELWAVYFKHSTGPH